MTEEAAGVMKRGLAGIHYLADVIGTGWRAFDGTPADVAVAGTTFNQMLASD